MEVILAAYRHTTIITKLIMNPMLALKRKGEGAAGPGKFYSVLLMPEADFFIETWTLVGMSLYWAPV